MTFPEPRTRRPARWSSARPPVRGSERLAAVVGVRSGAYWRHPEGPGSSIESRQDHPVVHVAFDDAQAYAAWIGKRLRPKRSGVRLARRSRRQRFRLGDEMEPGGKPFANTWQGEFPWQNLERDGYLRTAPVGQFPPNGYGLYDMPQRMGMDERLYVASREAPAAPCCASESPRDAIEKSYDPAFPDIRIPRKVLKAVRSVRAQLLSSLPPGRAFAADDRLRHVARRLPLRDELTRPS